jgi:hypothetical protein
MDELLAVLLGVLARMEGLISRIEAGSVRVTDAGAGSDDDNQNYLQLLRAQRDDLDKAIALARNPQRKAY